MQKTGMLVNDYLIEKKAHSCSWTELYLNFWSQNWICDEIFDLMGVFKYSFQYYISDAQFGFFILGRLFRLIFKKHCNLLTSFSDS